MTEEWLEHVDLPEGQSADLLKRYPYERATMIELAAERDMAVTQALLREGGARVRPSASRSPTSPTWSCAPRSGKPSSSTR